MENQRKATPKQLAYIQQLRSKQGKESLEIDEELSFQDASNLIKDLLEILSRDDQNKPIKINEARLGMVMKECYRYFRHYEKDIHKEYKEIFKKDVIKTYQLFAEIAQGLESKNNQLAMEG